jgi:hypothetical protein
MNERAVMVRKLLICVSEDPAFLHGVRFVSHFFQPAPDLHFDLAFIPHSDLPPGHANCLELPEAVGWARSMLAEKGFTVGTPFSTKTCERFLSVRDLADIVQKLHYDAVILGRRGINRLVEYLNSGFNESVYDQYLDFPFWLCREPDLRRKNVLLCVDGSKPGLCAADHVGFMCAPEARHQICVVYLADPDKRDYRDEILILDNAIRMLQVNTISEARIKTKILVEKDHAQGILREAEKGAFAAVVVGRAGSGRGMMKEQQFGSVSLRLARELSGASLWVCGYPCKL